MNNPELYAHVDNIPKCGAQQALQEFGNKINWRCNGRDSVLDAGCGPGDVTVDILMPYLPANFSRLVGVDISEAMIDYAQKTYVRPNLSFELFDLAKDLEKQPFRCNAKSFDHIFSFYVLMWISNIGTYLRNFHKLLVPNGNLVILTIGKYPAYDIYKEQARDKRWAKYITMDIYNKMSPFASTKYVDKDFCNVLTKYGFTDCEVRILQKNVTFDNMESLRGFFQSVSPFYDRLPAEEKTPYLDDFVGKVIKLCTRPNGDGNEDNIILPGVNAMVYARKRGG